MKRSEKFVWGGEEEDELPRLIEFIAPRLSSPQFKKDRSWSTSKERDSSKDFVQSSSKSEDDSDFYEDDREESIIIGNSKQHLSSLLWTKAGSQKDFEHVLKSSINVKQVDLHHHHQTSSTLDSSKSRNKEEDIIPKFDIVGDDYTFQGPFGHRRCIYLDQTASGRAVVGIEAFIYNRVLPVYANTHSTTSNCAAKVTGMREEARKTILAACGGDMEDDEVIFCGNGTTSAVHKVVHSISKKTEAPPVVIVGPFEHHSNLLPWREISADVIRIPENSHGLVDQKYLERVLKSLQAKKVFESRLVIGSFSAGSNVTGVLTDDVSLTVMLHKYGAYSFWDYAAAAPHVPIRMNPKGDNAAMDRLARKDAIFFSGHKFIGGPQSPGVLIAKKSIFRNPVPDGHGGGTVLFVTRTRHQYLTDIAERNEGGTPNIVGDIRLALVFQLQSSIGISAIMRKERYYTKLALQEWGKVEQVVILGPSETPRLPIISLMIRHLPSGLFLHHDFLVVVLNDLFGIQVRGGCMCAGPYAQGLLGIDDKLAKAYEDILSTPRHKRKDGKESFDSILKPGFVRISLPYHASHAEIQYAIEAVTLVAQHGWKLLPFYTMDIEKGTFRFQTTSGSKIQSTEIGHFNLDSMRQQNLDKDTTPMSLLMKGIDVQEHLQVARNLLESAGNLGTHSIVAHPEDEEFPPDRAPFRWFLLPSEALRFLKNRGRNNLGIFRHPITKVKAPFHPLQKFKVKELGTFFHHHHDSVVGSVEQA